MKIGIIVGSVRQERLGGNVGQWVHEAATTREGTKREGVAYELIDLKNFDVPVFDSATNPMAAKKQYESDAVTKWSEAIDACDGFIFVTAEYNHGVPGAFKNAVDSLGPEWVGKAVAFVGYGSVGGVRAIEQWRQIIANFSMVDVRAEINLSLFSHFADGAVQEEERHAGELKAVFDQVEAAAGRQAG